MEGRAVIEEGGRSIGNVWAEFMAAQAARNTDRRDAIEAAYQQLDNAKLVGKVVVHRYLCRNGGHPLATVIRISDVTIVRTRDYKFSPGMNRERTVESARRKNTLDGNRHWPGCTYDVTDLAASDTGGTFFAVDMSCRHDPKRMVRAIDVLTVTENVAPGHPSKPTIL